MVSMYRAVFESILRFGGLVFGSASEKILNDLFLLQKKALRHTRNANFIDHTDPIFYELKLLKLKDLIIYSRVCLVHKFRLGLLPKSFTRNYFEYVSEEEQSRRGDPLCLKIPNPAQKNLYRSP